MKNIRFEKIDDMWIPMEADRKIDQTYGSGGFWKSSGHIKRTEVILNPDHEALGSFVPDIPNGWSVRFKDFKGIDGKEEYTWQDGEVVDENGRKVDLDKLINKK